MTTEFRQAIRLFPPLFLSSLILFCLLNSLQASANVCVHPTLRLSRVQGVVTDQMGEIIPGALVTLKRNGSSDIETTTDSMGRFALKRISGQYWLQIKAPGFAYVSSPVKIGFDIRNLIHSDTLRVILPIGGDYCESPTTSKREFQNKINAYNRQYKGIDQKNATQK